ncbi:hypothetical protein L249_5287 [Ophiocordyceps polyrhachis-furcata BCC 54312]|uniref:Uncharacterized protein n=1 Tax=Ophiocordyceps polyrhachis-furcata BCC 54312 TaxID=1330021 RepID=A0A367L906_9HYPO|nr:hypothetical protein L249_5287 [Ophiocordyceps polyrhachis-furcata BCC 54312]
MQRARKKSRPNASNDSEGYLSLYKASSDALAALYIDSSLLEPRRATSSASREPSSARSSTSAGQSKGRLRTPDGDPSHLPLLDPTPNKGETARRPISGRNTLLKSIEEDYKETYLLPIINEKAAILDALYEVKHLAYKDAVALEIYDSLRLERSRDRNRTYDIAETNGQP